MDMYGKEGGGVSDAYLSSMSSPVLLHGFTGSAASWGDALVDALASAGHPPVLLDAPGHGARAGETDPAAFTPEAVWARVDEAGGWSRADGRNGADGPPGDGRGPRGARGGAAGEGGTAGPLRGGEPFPLVGYSMGGRLALSYAVAHPDRVSALVLESASPGLATEEERASRRASDEALARRLEGEGMEAFVDFWESLPLFESRGALPAEVRARQRALRLGNDPASLAMALRGLGTGALPSFWDRLPELEVPVLLLVGALDRKFVGIARAMAGLLPDAEVVVVPEAGHTVHLERPGAWVEAVVGFLGEAPGGRGGSDVK